MLTGLEVSSLACKCAFYRPEHNQITDQSQFGQNISVHLKDLISLFQKMLWIIGF